jgi:hypothetical protein
VYAAIAKSVESKVRFLVRNKRSFAEMTRADHRSRTTLPLKTKKPGEKAGRIASID